MSMTKVIQSEFSSDDNNLKKDPNTSKFFSEPKSVFFTTQEKPYTKLLILGDFEVSDCSKKRELLASSTCEKLKVNDRKNNSVFLGEQNNGIVLFVSDYNYYDKYSSPPACLSATMIVIIPNSAEDLRVCFNSIYNRPHKPAKDSKVVYINLFDPNSDEYGAIESKAKELNFSNSKLDLKPNTFDTLIDTALRHTEDVFARLTQPNKLVESDSNSQKSGPDSGSCAIL